MYCGSKATKSPVGSYPKTFRDAPRGETKTLVSFASPERTASQPTARTIIAPSVLDCMASTNNKNTKACQRHSCGVGVIRAKSASHDGHWPGSARIGLIGCGSGGVAWRKLAGEPNVPSWGPIRGHFARRGISRQRAGADCEFKRTELAGPEHGCAFGSTSNGAAPGPRACLGNHGTGSPRHCSPDLRRIGRLRCER